MRFFYAILILLFTGCSTGKHYVNLEMSEQLPTIALPNEVRVYTNGEAAPDSSRIIGEAWTEHEPTAKKQTYDSTLAVIREAVSAVGGNGFYVMEHRKPNHIETVSHDLYGMVLLSKDSTIYSRTDNPFSTRYAEYNKGLNRQRVGPHHLHLDVGMSSLDSKVSVIDEDERILDGTLERAVGLNASYNYLVPYSLYGFGLVYNSLFSNVSIAERHGTMQPYYSVRNTFHSIVPTVIMYGSSRKIVFSISIGLGYMWSIYNWDYANLVQHNKKEIRPFLVTYGSIECEYRITHNWGISGRSYINESVICNTGEDYDYSILGLSIGINYHF